MQIKIDDVVVYTISEAQMAVIKDCINSDGVNAFIARIVETALSLNIDSMYQRFRSRWEKMAIAEHEKGIIKLPYLKHYLSTGEVHAELIPLVINMLSYADKKSRDIKALQECSDIIKLENTFQNISEAYEGDNTELKQVFMDKQAELQQKLKDVQLKEAEDTLKKQEASILKEMEKR